MKKLLLLTLIGIFSLSAWAQDTDDENYYEGVELSKELNLTSDQIAKIKKLNREVGPQFEAIGRDRSLSGYEKGQRKRALALKHKKEVTDLLTTAQINKWEEKHGKMHSDRGLRDDMTDNIDDKIKALEKKYDRDERAIEDNDYLSKAEKKAQKKALKESFKVEKEKLKRRKELIKENY